MPRKKKSPKSSPSRRRSGRIRRAPEGFDPTPSSVRKRKRQSSGEVQVVPPEIPYVEVYMEHSEEEDESDYEMLKNKKTTKSKKVVSGKKGSKAAKLKKDPLGVEDGEYQDSIESNLFAIKDPDAAIESVVIEWLDDYQDDMQSALKEFVNFVLKTAGSTSGVTNFDIEDKDTIPDTLSQIQHRMESKTLGAYPLVSRKADFKNFRKAVFEFIKRLINAAADRDFLYDGMLIESIDSWLSPLSSSTYRPFRYTSTSLALHFVTCLCDVYIKVEKERAIAMRQLEVESKKARSSSVKRKTLDDKIDNFVKKEETIKVAMTNFFDSVFIHRYRDVDARIRIQCVHELGNWMLKLPFVFFESSYLRYLGWILSDMHAPARHEVIRTLTKLYEDDSCVVPMRHFTEKFKSRLIEMALKDVDVFVRAASTSLLNELRLHGFLEHEEIHDICKLLYDSEARIRYALAPFISGIMENDYSETIGKMGADVDTFEQQTELEQVKVEWVKLKCFVDILIRYNIPSQANEPVDTSYTRICSAALSLCEQIPILQDWEAISEYLLYDSSLSDDDVDGSLALKMKRAIQLDKEQERVLLRIFNACVHTVTKPLEPTKEAPRKRKKAKLDLSTNSQEAISRSLTLLIPKLLQKFSPIPSTTADVLRLQQLTKLDIYQQLRQTSAYEKLLEDIGRQVMNHADTEVLAEASGALLHAQSFESLQTSTTAKIREIQDDAVEELLLAAEGKRLTNDTLDNETLQELTIRILRVEYLASVSDPVSALEISQAKFNGNGIGVICNLIERGKFSFDEREAAIITHAMKAFRWYFMWKLQRLVTSVEEFDIRKIERMKSRRDSVISCLVGNIESTLKDVVFESTCLLVDLHTMFSSLKTLDNDNLGKFNFKISPEQGTLILGTLREEMQDFATISGRELVFDVESVSPKPGNQDEGHGIPLQSHGNFSDSCNQQLKIEAEKRLSEITGKVALAILSGSLDNTFQEHLTTQKGKLGPSYDKILSELDHWVNPGRRGSKGNIDEVEDLEDIEDF